VVLVKGNQGNVDLTIRLAAFPALGAVGGVARVDGNTLTPIGVARLGAQRFAAYGLACPHEQVAIDPTGNGWRCPKHGARFASDGALLQGPATVGLTPLTVSYDALAGTIRIRGNAAASKPGDDD
jgi:Rieske Fe-S protein